jgi:hypothetical protein
MIYIEYWEQNSDLKKKCLNKTKKKKKKKERKAARHWWLTPVILATQEAEIRRIAVQRQHSQIDCKTLSPKKTHH